MSRLLERLAAPDRWTCAPARGNPWRRIPATPADSTSSPDVIAAHRTDSSGPISQVRLHTALVASLRKIQKFFGVA
jgi:hypothetical protein